MPVPRLDAPEIARLLNEFGRRGILHAHTTESDGVNTLAQMAGAVRKRGYSYFGVADHSRSAHYAGGLSSDQLEAQHEAINESNARYGDASMSSKALSPTFCRTALSTIPMRS
jgi:DNA polymerase (family X)